jgi:hypothetical protein
MENKSQKETDKCTLYGVSSSITVSKGNNPFNVHISSKSSFFNEPIVYSLKGGCIYLRHSTIDDNKNKVVPHLDKKTNFYHFYISVGYEEIDLKKYDFEDDSTEDCVIIYYC